MRLNLHIYPTSFSFESRITKEINSILSNNLFDKVIVLGLSDGKLPAHEVHKNGKMEIRRLANLKLPSFVPRSIQRGLSYLLYILQSTLKYRRVEIDTLNCHSLNVLIIGYLLKRFGKTKVLIYDTHELETEREGLGGRGQKISKWLEKKLIGHVDYTLTVCSPITDWYLKEYNLEKVYTLRNIPDMSIQEGGDNSFRKVFSIPDEELIFLYQGILNENRGILLLLEAFSQTPDKHLVLMGFGPLEETITKWSKQFSNIHFMEAVPPKEILSWTRSADCGVFILTTFQSLSYQFSLPNKFFEYLKAGLPLMVSNTLPYQYQLVSENNLGFTLDVVSKKELVSLLNSTSKEKLNSNIESVKNFAESVTWDSDFNDIKHIYNEK